MTMIKRGSTGHIESYSKETDDGAIVCGWCDKIIVSSANLEDGNKCPYCHNDVNQKMSEEVIQEV